MSARSHAVILLRVIRLAMVAARSIQRKVTRPAGRTERVTVALDGRLRRLERGATVWRNPFFVHGRVHPLEPTERDYEAARSIAGEKAKILHVHCACPECIGRE